MYLISDFIVDIFILSFSFTIYKFMNLFVFTEQIFLYKIKAIRLYFKTLPCLNTFKFRVRIYDAFKFRVRIYDAFKFRIRVSYESPIYGLYTP